VPPRRNRKNGKNRAQDGSKMAARWQQDGRALRRYNRRGKVERLFAWRAKFPRLLVRQERKAAHFPGLAPPATILILVRNRCCQKRLSREVLLYRELDRIMIVIRSNCLFLLHHLKRRRAVVIPMRASGASSATVPGSGAAAAPAIVTRMLSRKMLWLNPELPTEDTVKLLMLFVPVVTVNVLNVVATELEKVLESEPRLAPVPLAPANAVSVPVSVSPP
jgi:hypothetical protein